MIENRLDRDAIDECRDRAITSSEYAITLLAAETLNPVPSQDYGK
ncbi:hypothetical protein [Acidiphilium sp.]|nr:hypothetical protein [Acidiphilium sp.]